MRGLFQAVLLWMAGAGLAHAATCSGHNLIDKSATACLAKDVRNMDARMDKLYQSLLDKSPADAKSRIEASQSAFIKERDVMCLIDSSSLSREQWYARMAKSDNLMLCEMRYLHGRAVQLKKLLAALGQASPQAGQVLSADRLKFRIVNEDYQLISRNMHRHGRWYMEVAVNGAALANVNGVDSSAIEMLCGSGTARKGNGWTAYTSAHDNHASVIYSLALDLDRGRLYLGKNGTWLNGKPGVSGGAVAYRKGGYSICGVFSSQRIADLLASKTINVNFGEHPFVYDPPKSFKPFHARSVWIPLKGRGVTVSLDYSAIDLHDAQPHMLVRNVFDKGKAADDGYRYRVTYGQFDVDCNSGSFREVLAGLAPKPSDMYSASANMQVEQPISIATLPANSIEGSAARTICFLKKNGFALPRLDTAGKWKSMRSPIPVITIAEAPDQRQYRNGYMLVKMKNVFSKDLASFGGKAGATHFGYFAVACGKHRENSMLVFGLDAKGNIAGGSFYDADNAMPKLPENRKRIEDACRAYLSNRAAYEKRSAPRPAAVTKTGTAHAMPLPAPRRVAAHRQAKPAHRALHAHAARGTQRYASHDKDLRYCLDKPTNEAIIACTEKGNRASP